MSRRQSAALLVMTGAGIVLWAGAIAHASGYGSHQARTAQGYLGVDLHDLTDDEVSSQRLKDLHGAEIVRVDHDGPAGKAGLREHDVILQLNGQAIAGQEQLRHMLRDTAPGQTVTLVIVREAQQQTVTATMANRQEVERRAWEQHIVVPDPNQQPAAAADGERADTPPPSGMGFFHGGSGATGHSHGFLGTMLGAPYTGLAMEPVGPQLGEFFGVQSGVGLLVKSVDANSPGAVAGMRAGDVVLKVSQATMSSESDWSKILHESKGKNVPVLVLRDRKEQTLTLTPDAKGKARLDSADRDDALNGAELAQMNLLGGRD